MSGADLTLVLGGARSGKSVHAERLVDGTLDGAAPRASVYIATCDAAESARHDDREMLERIAGHRARRGPHWTTVEAPLELPGALRAHAADPRPALVDCLTLWVSNLLLVDRDIAGATTELLAAVDATTGPVTLVANEVGLGVVPGTSLGRRFRDEAGRLNIHVAARARRVILMTAGIPMTLKG